MYKAMKFNIGNNPEVSKRVQEILFELGYKWEPDAQKAKYTGEPYLFTGTYKDNAITWNDDEETFKSSTAEEINIEWMKPQPKETVELNGKKYLKSELETALQHLKPVED